MNEVKTTIKKNTIFLYIFGIAIVSLLLKLYLVDFTIPVTSDNLDYLLMSLSFQNGDFTQSTHRTSGWPLFVSLFYSLFESENFYVYSNVIRILSISVSTVTIPLIYLVARKFFDQRYSIVCASLLAFEPHLIYNSGFGLSEPIFLLVVLVSFYFILNKNTKFIIPSLIFAGFSWWLKLDGFFIFIIIGIIYFVTFRHKKNKIRNFLIGFVLLILIVSPMLIQKYEQFDDPFYSYYGDVMFAGSYEDLLGENTKFNNSSAFEYIQNNDMFSFVENFFLQGIYNIIILLSKISFPYLMILIPFGIFFSFRAFDQDSQYIKSNWIFILLALGSMIFTLSIVEERRYLFYLFPYLIIFSTIPIQRVVEYGLNTFSFSRKQKDIFLVSTLLLVLILSTLFIIFGYEKPNNELENEKRLMSEFVLENLNGNFLRDFSSNMDYFNYQLITSPPNNFHEYKISTGMDKFRKNFENRNSIYISANSLTNLIDAGETFDLKYIPIYANDNGFNHFLNDVYLNEKNYPYLEKIFDSDELNFQKIKIKIFEIDYKKYHELYEKNLKDNHT